MTTFDEADDAVKREHAIFQLQRNRAIDALADCKKRLRDCCGGDSDHAPQMVGALILAMFALCFGLVCGFVAGNRHGKSTAVETLETRR